MRVQIMLVLIGTLAGAATAQENTLEKVQAALPDKPYAKPDEPRKLLVFSKTAGFRHSVIPLGVKTLEMMGGKTGAFDVTASSDIDVFEPDSLKKFDAVCFFNTTGELFSPPDFDKLPTDQQEQARAKERRLKAALLNFIKRGGGFVGIHAATDTFYQWPEYGEMIGGYFNGHPWNETVTIKLDEPDHPLNQMFEGDKFVVADEIYQFRGPYTRTDRKVLLSLDINQTNMTRPGIRREDGDFAISWIRPFEQGRVFYCSLGHRNEVFWNPKVLRHYLAGIQYALGDLKADDSPSHVWRPLFNGRDLSGWHGLVGSPPTRRAMTISQIQQAQAKADESMNAHWRVEGGELVFDGKGENLCTVEEFGDFELMVDWKIESGGDSGIYLRGSPQVQIWDPAQNPEGSGGLYNNQSQPNKPLVRADRPVGEWNTFRIRMVDTQVWVWLNGRLVVDNVTLENYWERDKPIYERGPIELQAHNAPIRFRNIRVRDISPTEAQHCLAAPAWSSLFDGRSLESWDCKPGSWQVEDGQLTRVGGGYIWTQRDYGDYTLSLEFKLAPKTNSGVFFRVGNPSDPVQTGMEVQVLDSFGKETVGKHDCGALYDCIAPSANAVHAPGEWNHLVLDCRGPLVRANLNGQPLFDANLDQWTEPHKNPDGSGNKFSRALKDFPRTGRIGFQDHGQPVWYRNVFIQPRD